MFIYRTFYHCRKFYQTGCCRILVSNGLNILPCTLSPWHLSYLSCQSKRQSLSTDRPLLGSNHCILPTHKLQLPPYLLICVGGDNWADHRCWGNLHRLHCGHRRHSSWDSGHRSSQYFLLKPGGAGRYHMSSLTKPEALGTFDSAFIPTNASPRPSGPIAPYGTTSQASENLEAAGLSGFARK